MIPRARNALGVRREHAGHHVAVRGLTQKLEDDPGHGLGVLQVQVVNPAADRDDLEGRAVPDKPPHVHLGDRVVVSGSITIERVRTKQDDGSGDSR